MRARGGGGRVGPCSAPGAWAEPWPGALVRRPGYRLCGETGPGRLPGAALGMRCDLTGGAPAALPGTAARAGASRRGLLPAVPLPGLPGHGSSRRGPEALRHRRRRGSRSASPFAGHSDGPAGWVWLGRLQPRPLCLLHPLDHRTGTGSSGQYNPSHAILMCFPSPCSADDVSVCPKDS